MRLRVDGGWDDCYMIAALCGRQLMAPFTVEYDCNRVVFECWLETCLLPQLLPKQVVVMDNATFHKGGRIAELLFASRLSVAVLAALFT